MSVDQRSQWSGRVVARILPQDIEDNYDQVRKPTGQRIDPLTLDKETSKHHNQSKSRTNSLGYGAPSSFPSNQPEYDSSLINIEIYLTFNALPEFQSLFSECIRLTRNSDEEASKCLQRIGISLEKKLNGKKGKKRKNKNAKNQQKSAAAIVRCLSSCSLLSGDGTLQQPQELDVTSMTSRQLFEKALTTSIDIEVIMEDMAISLTIESNPPTVLGIRTFEIFCGQNFPGIPLVVETDLLFATHVIINWYVDDKLVYRDSRGYTPTLEQATKNLSITVTPIRPGHAFGEICYCQEAYQFQEPIANEIPENMVLTLRPEWQVPSGTGTYSNSHSSFPPPTSTVLPAPSEIRVMTYNILADQNAFSKGDKKVPYFPYVPAEIMVRSRRMPLVLHEILAYHADVICLQEVDQLVYDTLLRPVLEYQNYQGYFSVKQTSGTREGCAMFWSLKRFQRAETKDYQTHQIGHLLSSYSSVSLEDEHARNDSVGTISQLLESRPDLLEIVRDKLGHVVQIANLTDAQQQQGDNNQLVIANTHLFFHPMGNHIRLLQCFAICNLLSLEQIKPPTACSDEQGREGHRKPFILCGDLNTSLENVGALMIQRHTPENYRRTKRDLNAFTWQPTIDENNATTTATNSCSCSSKSPQPRDEDDFPALCLPPSFPTVRAAYTETPAFTHYVEQFHAALDHIVITTTAPPEDGDDEAAAVEHGTRQHSWFHPIRFAKMPTKEEVTRNVAMPSINFPSDHISLVCDLEWKTLS